MGRWTQTGCVLLLGLLPAGVSVTSAEADEVGRWGVFDAELTSRTAYEKPLWDVSVSVQLTSPSGTSHQTRAFWDGQRRWRVRFSPDEVGTWTWQTTCSDETNEGLHARRGSFECAPATGNNPLQQHGPIRLSENRLFFEHADGQPFFFLSCTAWNGVLKSTTEEWERYLSTRQDQRFTAIQFVSTQWRGGRTTLDQPVFIDGEQIAINPEMFQRMDQRVAAINGHGLVACPVILWALGDDDPGNALSESNALKLAQYIIDRWGAYNVIWFLAGDCRFRDESVPRWKSLGQSLFGDAEGRRLVTLHPSGENWMVDKFRHQDWYDFVGYQSGHGDAQKTLAWQLKGPVIGAWKAEPTRPIVNIEPNYEAHPAYQSKQEHTPQHVRRAAYWSLMISPPAGVTYGHNTVWVWNSEAGPAEGHGNLKHVGPWTEGLRAPGAESMTHLRSFFESGPRSRLRPAQDLLAAQPVANDLNRFITVASTGNRNWTIAYTPTGEEVALQFSDPQTFSARWYDPRSGTWNQPLQITGRRIALRPPAEGDWVLDLRRSENVPAAVPGN